MIYQNLWHAGKAVLRGNCIALSKYIRKGENLKICYFINYLKKFKNKHVNPKKVKDSNK